LKVNCKISKQLNAFIFISAIPMQGREDITFFYMFHSVESQKAILHQENLHLRELNCIHSKHHFAQHNLQNFRLPVLAFQFSHHQIYSLSTAI